MTSCPTTALSAYTSCTSNVQWSAPGSTSCTNCELNHECFVGYSVPCKNNYYSVVGDFECHPCPAGKSCTLADPTSQSSCANGEYSPSGAMNCYDCPKGHMCNSKEMAKPVPCPPGYEQTSVGSTNCQACGNDEYTNIPGTIACLTLPPGYYGTTERGSSIPCPRGTYANNNQNGCNACTAGYLCGEGESVAAPAYAKCPIGYYCPVVSGAVVLKPCSSGLYGTSEGAATVGAG